MGASNDVRREKKKKNRRKNGDRNNKIENHEQEKSTFANIISKNENEKGRTESRFEKSWKKNRSEKMLKNCDKIKFKKLKKRSNKKSIVSAWKNKNGRSHGLKHD